MKKNAFSYAHVMAVIVGFAIFFTLSIPVLRFLVDDNRNPVVLGQGQYVKEYERETGSNRVRYHSNIDRIIGKVMIEKQDYKKAFPFYSEDEEKYKNLFINVFGANEEGVIENVAVKFEASYNANDYSCATVCRFRLPCSGVNVTASDNIRVNTPSPIPGDPSLCEYVTNESCLLKTDCDDVRDKLLIVYEDPDNELFRGQAIYLKGGYNVVLEEGGAN